MIQELTKLCPLAVAGGFIAYWNDNPLYPSDPAAMFRRALAVLITDGGQIYITPVDMTREELDPGAITFYPIARNQFARRSTGALFYKGCYFSIRTGDYAGPYQISSDLIKNTSFPNEKAYTKFLLKD